MVKEIYLAGGCFWGMEHLYRSISGVVDVAVGYANIRSAEEADYKTVCTGVTEARETAKIIYDDEVITLDELLEIFFEVVDPTQVDQQAHDIGTQYQSGIYWVDADDEQEVVSYVQAERKKYDVFWTELKPLKNFYPAEEYHQRYLEKNPGGYCHINPMKIAKLKEKYLKRG